MYSNTYRQTCQAYWQLMRLDKPIGTLLLLWPTLWALWVAGAGHPPVNHVIVFVLGVSVMRTAGCVINDIVDYRIDQHVTRTRSRPLAAGTLKKKQAYTALFILLILAFGLWLCLPHPAQLLGIASLLLTGIYPFCKRWTYFPQCILGLCFGGWSTLMVFVTLQAPLYPTGWILFFTNTLWTITYDTFYALCDRDDDVRLGVKSTAVFLTRYYGTQTYLILGLGQAIVLSLLISLMRLCQFGTYYLTALIIIGAIMLKQQYCLRSKGLQGAFDAFLMSHWVGCSLFLALLLEYGTHGH